MPARRARNSRAVPSLGQFEVDPTRPRSKGESGGQFRVSNEVDFAPGEVTRDFGTQARRLGLRRARVARVWGIPARHFVFFFCGVDCDALSRGKRGPERPWKGPRARPAKKSKFIDPNSLNAREQLFRVRLRHLGESKSKMAQSSSFFPGGDFSDSAPSQGGRRPERPWKGPRARPA